MSAAPRLIFVNIAVADIARARSFFDALGFTFNDQFSDATTFCMVVNPHAFFMVMTHDRYDSFIGRPRVDAHHATGALFAFNVDSREAVDTLMETALTHGATDAGRPQDHGFMYTRVFYDLDGHHWEVFWMDPAALEGDAPTPSEG